MTVFRWRYIPCEYCGEAVDRSRPEAHQCVPERVADVQMSALAAEIAAFDASYLAFLDSRRGRFEQWLAARELRGLA